MNTEDRLLTISNLQIEGRQDDKWKPVVKGVDVTLNRGEVIGLIGESGAGKSTIGLAAMGYARDGCRISGGTIDFLGQDLRKASERELEDIRGFKIAYVAQSAAASFNPSHRLMTQFAETPLEHKMMSMADIRKKAVGLYTRLFLPDPEGIGFRYPHQVSGGQLQRAMVAMAMACDPELLIADEPTTALDVTVQAQILDLMNKLKDEEGTAIQLITHDLGVIAEMSDRIVVMYAGCVVEESEAVELFKNTLHPYTEGLLQSIPVLGSRSKGEQKRLTEIKGMVPSLYDLPSGCSFRQRCSHTMKICSEQEPPLDAVNDKHAVRCWLHIAH